MSKEQVERYADNILKVYDEVDEAPKKLKENNMLYKLLGDSLLELQKISKEPDFKQNASIYFKKYTSEQLENLHTVFKEQQGKKDELGNENKFYVPSTIGEWGVNNFDTNTQNLPYMNNSLIRSEGPLRTEMINLIAKKIEEEGKINFPTIHTGEFEIGYSNPLRHIEKTKNLGNLGVVTNNVTQNIMDSAPKAAVEQIDEVATTRRREAAIKTINNIAVNITQTAVNSALQGVATQIEESEKRRLAKDLVEKAESSASAEKARNDLDVKYAALEQGFEKAIEAGRKKDSLTRKHAGISKLTEIDQRVAELHKQELAEIHAVQYPESVKDVIQSMKSEIPKALNSLQLREMTAEKIAQYNKKREEAIISNKAYEANAAPIQELSYDEKLKKIDEIRVKFVPNIEAINQERGIAYKEMHQALSKINQDAKSLLESKKNELMEAKNKELISIEGRSVNVINVPQLVQTPEIALKSEVMVKKKPELIVEPQQRSESPVSVAHQFVAVEPEQKIDVIIGKPVVIPVVTAEDLAAQEALRLQEIKQVTEELGQMGKEDLAAKVMRGKIAFQMAKAKFSTGDDVKKQAQKAVSQIVNKVVEGGNVAVVKLQNAAVSVKDLKKHFEGTSK